MDSTDQNPPETYEMLNHKWSAHIKEDQFRGCMLGGAVGDALGAPIEFMTLAAIKTKFESNGITEFAPAYGKTGAITDDTQMTLFTAEGAIRYWHGGVERSIQAPFEDVLRHSYLRWLTTQGMATKDSELAEQSECIEDGWLQLVPAVAFSLGPRSSVKGPHFNLLAPHADQTITLGLSVPINGEIRPNMAVENTKCEALQPVHEFLRISKIEQRVHDGSRAYFN